MNIPTGPLVFFFLAMMAAVFMIAEGSSILFLKKRFTPLPSRVLAGLSRLVAGRSTGGGRFSGQISLKALTTYASCDLMFGTLVLISSCAYLFGVV